MAQFVETEAINVDYQSEDEGENDVPTVSDDEFIDDSV